MICYVIYTEHAPILLSKQASRNRLGTGKTDILTFLGPLVFIAKTNKMERFRTCYYLKRKKWMKSCLQFWKCLTRKFGNFPALWRFSLDNMIEYRRVKSATMNVCFTLKVKKIIETFEVQTLPVNNLNSICPFHVTALL